MRNEAQKTLLDHLAAPGKAEEVVVCRKAGAAQPAPQRRHGRGVSRPSKALLGKGAAQRNDRLLRQANGPHAEFSADLDDHPGNRRMEVHVLMGVDVIERETGRAKGRELRPDLARQGAANRGQKKEPEAGPEEGVVECAVLAKEPFDFLPRRNRRALDENEMKADLEARHAPRPSHRIGGRRGADHQARGGENSVTMRFFDGLVDRLVETEIIRREDEALQLAISRLLRN